MRKSLTLIAFLAAAVLAAVSCKPEVKPGDNTDTPTPGPGPDKKVPAEQTFNVKAGDSVTLEFESYAAWTAKSDVEWISVTPDSGEA
ncbi:MAG: hypothetical protein MJY67_01815, partial [Bacteroidales bacterium]|nr:hypothetical protein [Bacteroidales bacterium]